MNNNTKKAVALRYDGTGAPCMIAKGDGKTAENILELAKSHGIPIQYDPMLTSLLSSLELNEEIPVELYHAVAELLCFLYELNGKAPEDYC